MAEKQPNILVIWGDDIGIANVTPFLATFKEFPPRQKAASFTIDQALEKMNDAAGGAGR